MTIRNLEAIFRPRSVALFGASEREGSLGRVVMQNLLAGGFDGAILPVNPKHRRVLGRPCHADAASMPETPDLAVLAVPAREVPRIVAELGARGTRGVVVVSAGFNALLPDCGSLQQAMLDAARPHLVRIVGPNTLGVLVPGIGLNASFAHLTPQQGGIAFLAQSGAITTSVLDWAHARGIGFSALVSLGDMADVDFGDMLDYFATDAATRAVLLYVEAVTHARKFMSAARAAARLKPVVVVKAGRHERSGQAAASHTGRLAGPDAEYDAAFRRAGMLRVAVLEDLFAAVETLALARPPAGPRLLVLSNGGGTAVLAADALIDRGGELATLSPPTVAALDRLLPPTWSKGNPVDIVGDASPERYAAALRVVLGEPRADAVLILHCPTAVASGLGAATAVVDVLAEFPRATVFTSWVGEHTAQSARREFERAGVPTYATPEQAVRAFMQLVDYRRNQNALMETPPSEPERHSADAAAARRIVEAALAAGREWLTSADARAVLAAYGIAVNRVSSAASPAEAAAAAARLGVPVALKIDAEGGLHKSDVGGVVLELVGAEAVEAAAAAMIERVRASAPGVEVRGFTVEPMIDRRHALELIVGVSVRGDFGPVILFGRGGTAVEVNADTAVELPPLNLRLARRLMERTRVYREMCGFRDVPAVDLDAVALTLTRVSQLLVALPEVQELDVNPLLASPAGAVALDARIRIAPAAGDGQSRLAIRPYPRELEETVECADGRTLLVRPIVPEDEPPLREGFAKLTPEEVRARFFVALKTMTHQMAARLTQIDYDREMALVLAEPGVPGRAEIYGVVHLVADPDNHAAEFAIVVERRYTGQGYGKLLMRRILDYARGRGIEEVFGEVLADNVRMRGLCRSLGFTEAPIRGSPGVVRVSRAP